MKLFDSIKIRAPRKNKFDLSHDRKFSARMGMLVPMFLTDVVPGDDFRVSSEILLRFAPMLAPVMHRVNVFTHYFFVPNRLIWDEWEDFITGGREGTANPIPPHVLWNEDYQGAIGGDGAFQPGLLNDYLGIPTVPSGTVATQGTKISVLPHRAYQLTYDEYFRDQNLSTPVDCLKTSGLQTVAEFTKLCTMRARCWEKDYFTSALPWAQRGGAVLMPVEGDADVTYKDVSQVKQSSGVNPFSTTPIYGDPATSNLTVPSSVGPTSGRIENIDEITFQNASVTINDLRRSIRLQEWLEKNARGGARYIEQILSHFGVVSSDARLQRPEYLGGGKQPVSISEVLQTAQSTDLEGLPTGNMAGHGISVGKTNGFSKRFEEHGYVIGLMSVLPKTAYQNGLPRYFSRESRFDYYWPEFANIGEQEIKEKEIYINESMDPGAGENTWGYQSRYAEYKYQNSSVHGDFRESLAFWHMGRIFGNTGAPPLNESFVNSDPTNRIFAVLGQSEGTNQPMWCMCHNRVSARRPMPYYGTPTI